MNDPIIDDQLASLNLDFLVSMLFLLIITSSIISIAEGRLMTTEKTEQLAEASLISGKVAKTNGLYQIFKI